MRTDEEIIKSINDDVMKWMKRLNRKGPFYLLSTETEPHTIYRWEAGVRIDTETTKQVYCVIWNDKEKTKLGYFQDYMCTRYGVSTRCVLNGDTPFDLWNGAGTTDEEFAEMLKVRNGESELPHFDLDSLVGLKL